MITLFTFLIIFGALNAAAPFGGVDAIELTPTRVLNSVAACASFFLAGAVWLEAWWN